MSVQFKTFFADSGVEYMILTLIFFPQKKNSRLRNIEIISVSSFTGPRYRGTLAILRTHFTFKQLDIYLQL